MSFFFSSFNPRSADERVSLTEGQLEPGGGLQKPEADLEDLVGG